MRDFFLTEPNISFRKFFLYVFIVCRWTPSIYSSIVKCKLKDKTKNIVLENIFLFQHKHGTSNLQCFGNSSRLWPCRLVPRPPPEHGSLEAVTFMVYRSKLRGIWWKEIHSRIGRESPAWEITRDPLKGRVHWAWDGHWRDDWWGRGRVTGR